ncbi:spindlin interactor and repressor of chromatin-binding protein isoform X2 [Ornithorhynchus anatinus]|uniref:spindlin interactor and repressor of chromatin-binding protein isoform X2 n=1 Tax=Ornithorhynchus anatinus TaxID=9258 RepID=UPI0010A77F47|nr:spindlin interactor and repressor of chromatin-binding protein isoform X2 [Ornithorhynchus anatinus]
MVLGRTRARLPLGAYGERSRTMAVKAEPALLDYIKVTLKCEKVEEEAVMPQAPHGLNPAPQPFCFASSKDKKEPVIQEPQGSAGHLDETRRLGHRQLEWDADLPKGPAEIEVSLDPEEQPLHRRRAARPMQLPAPSTVELESRKPRGRRWAGLQGRAAAKKKRGRTSCKASVTPEPPDPVPEPDAAPAEIRLFSDGSFPAGFTFRLFSKSRMESPKVRASFEEKGCTEGDPSQAQSPLPASSSGLRGALGLKVIHLCLDDSPTGSLLQDWPNHPQGPKGVGTCDTLRLADGTAGKC